MARTIYIQCDRCGKHHDGKDQYLYRDPESGEEFLVNSFRIGAWNQKKKRWESIASGYDICEDCARQICDVIFGGSENMVKMRKVQNKDDRPGRVVASANPIEEEQAEFTAAQEDRDDGK